jgi:hypothetical protein
MIPPAPRQLCLRGLQVCIQSLPIGDIDLEKGIGEQRVWLKEQLSRATVGFQKQMRGSIEASK